MRVLSLPAGRLVPYLGALAGCALGAPSAGPSRTPLGVDDARARPGDPSFRGAGGARGGSRARDRVAAALAPAPSCTGAPGAGDDRAGESCCARIRVPASEALLSLDERPDMTRVFGRAFELDKFEVTVGRVRAWVEAGRKLLEDGALLFRGEDGEEVCRRSG